MFSDKVTFFIGGRSVKEKVTRKKGERFYPTCIQNQLHQPKTQPCNVWGTIGYNYKSLLIFLKGSGKGGSLTQLDYLAQVLQGGLQDFLAEFALITREAHQQEPLFMEDGNSAHGKKSATNPCAQFCWKHRIKTTIYPAIFPDMNPIEKCWRAMKQSLHRCKKQPTNEQEMQDAILEEWEALDQDWINSLILEQKHWVRVLVQRKG